MPFDIDRSAHAHQMKLLGLTLDFQIQLFAAHVYLPTTGNQYVLGVEYDALRARDPVHQIKAGHAAANRGAAGVLREQQSQSRQVYSRQLGKSGADIAM